MVNPAQVKNYGDSQLRRTKTDASDEVLTAAWQPPAPEVREIQSLLRHWEALIHMLPVESQPATAGIEPLIVLVAIQVLTS